MVGKPATSMSINGMPAIEAHIAKPTESPMRISAPGLGGSAPVSVSGTLAPGRYYPLKKRWLPGDKVRVEFDMRPQLVESNARVAENNGRVVVKRGPLVYCLEQLDQPTGTELADVSIRARTKNPRGGFSESFEKDLLGGVMVLRHEGAVGKTSPARSSLYFSADAPAGASSKVELKFIPYYAWANRRPTPMQVWTPLQRS